MNYIIDELALLVRLIDFPACPRFADARDDRLSIRFGASKEELNRRDIEDWPRKQAFGTGGRA